MYAYNAYMIKTVNDNVDSRFIADVVCLREWQDAGLSLSF